MKTWIIIFVCAAIYLTAAADDSTPAFRATQPDYQKWQSVSVKMDEQQVIELLGQPLAKPDPFDRNSDVLYSWEYGYLTPKSAIFPRPLVFRIRFQRGKVFAVEDPFNGSFSQDGSPTIPQTIWAVDPPMFDHYPRLLDLRWYPAAGIYPMRYEVEIGELRYKGNAEVSNGWYTKVIATDIPYLANEFDGDSRGRWRVRAINSKGTGDWSEYREFVFAR